MYKVKDFFTEGKQRDYGLDVLRAIAICAVILYHYPRHESQLVLRAISHFGYWGVDLFFVLSGFLIGGQCFRSIKKSDKFSIKNFYWRRFLRTLPNYYVFLVIVLLIEGVGPALEKFDWRYLFFLQNIGGLYYQGHTWSLCIEEHFYLLFPFVAIWIARLRNASQVFKFFFLVVLAGIGLRAFIWFYFRYDILYHQDVDKGFDVYFTYIYYPSFSRVDGLLFGVLLAYVQTYIPEQWSRWTQRGNLKFIVSVILIGAVCALSFYKVGWPNSIFSFPLISFGFSLLLLACQDQKCFLNKLKIPGVTLVSVLSYSLYLSHVYAYEFALSFVHMLGLAEFGFVAAFLRIVVILACALLMFSIVERPFLYFRSYLLSKK